MFWFGLFLVKNCKFPACKGIFLFSLFGLLGWLILFSSSLFGLPINLSLLKRAFILWYFSWITMHFLLQVSISKFNLEIFFVSSNTFFYKAFFYLLRARTCLDNPRRPSIRIILDSKLALVFWSASACRATRLKDLSLWSSLLLQRHLCCLNP